MGIVLAAGLVLGGIAWVVAGPRLAWRGKVLVMQARGEIPGGSWGDALGAIGLGGDTPGARLARATAVGNIVRNPYDTEADRAIGQTEYRARCATCHGLSGEGATGPALTSGQFARGATSMAIYQTIQAGVPGTAMVPVEAPDSTLWRLAAYVAGLSLEADHRVEEAAGREAPVTPLGPERLLAGSGVDWVTYSGSYDGHRHSPLGQVDRENVDELELVWLKQMATMEQMVESSPIVIDGVMYVTEPPDVVHALDAATGETFWSFDYGLSDRVQTVYGRLNRGVAVSAGRVYVGTLDAHLVALDARTGQVVWDVEVADHQAGYSITGAPLAVGDLVVIGTAGGMNGIRGRLDAYDAGTGDHRWRFYTIPGPGEPGHDSWSGDSWQTGGAATWNVGSYDPELDLLYWGTGNPAPPFDGEVREGDNLYANSVVALEAGTGELRWYFQFTPHDLNDWDSTQIPVLVDGEWEGESRKLMYWANRNGFFYVLDRRTGEFLLGTPFAKQTWAEGLDESGRPIRAPGAEPSAGGVVMYPGFLGATNWWSPSYSAVTGLLYVPVWRYPNLFIRRPEGDRQEGDPFYGGYAGTIPGTKPTAAVQALDPSTGKTTWEFPLPGESMGGIVSTASNLLFFGHGDRFYAADAASGEELFRFRTGGRTVAAPVVYSVGGEQRISVAAGRAIFTFGLRGIISPGAP